MARYYSGRRGRYYRRGYRRGYRRYGGTSLRRYRSIQMNDNETRIMTFTSVCRLTLPPGVISSTYGTGLASIVRIDPINLMGPEYKAEVVTVEGNQTLQLTRSSFVSSQSGRIFFAGFMFDRLRFRSQSCTIRPSVMPSGSTAGNYSLYAAWDRYGSPQFDGSGSRAPYDIFTDPSAKQVMWTPGGSGSPLRTWIYSTYRDRFQYIGIVHNTANAVANNQATWTLTPSSSSSSAQSPSQPFFPVLILSLNIPSTADNTAAVTLYVTTRFVIEFQGGFSTTTLNMTGNRSASLEQRVALLESRYNSNPADNNDDLVSVLNELSNPQ